jgi:hypothetical protein
MAHQWIIWKALLDDGEGGFAAEIARVAMDVYAGAERKTGHCHENFLAGSGEAAGCRHFGALSAAVVSFYDAYYRPGRVSTGFDVYVTDRENDALGFPVKLKLNSPFKPRHTTTLLMVLLPNTRYVVNGIECVTDENGGFDVILEIETILEVNIARMGV